MITNTENQAVYSTVTAYYLF